MLMGRQRRTAAAGGSCLGLMIAAWPAGPCSRLRRQAAPAAPAARRRPPARAHHHRLRRVHCRRRRPCRPRRAAPFVWILEAVLPTQGNAPDRRDRNLPVLHQAPPQPAVAGHLRPLRRRDRADDARRLQGALGHQLPRGPVDRRHRLHLPQRHGRQDRHLQHGGARAGQDRRLPGQQADRPHQDRREAARAQHRGAARLVPRRGRDPPRRRPCCAR